MSVGQYIRLKRTHEGSTRAEFKEQIQRRADGKIDDYNLLFIRGIEVLEIKGSWARF